jgi:hypothetical protein
VTSKRARRSALAGWIREAWREADKTPGERTLMSLVYGLMFGVAAFGVILVVLLVGGMLGALLWSVLS